MHLSIYKYIVCWKTFAPDFTFSTVSYRQLYGFNTTKPTKNRQQIVLKSSDHKTISHERKKKRNRTALVSTDLSRSSSGIVASDPLTRSSTRHTKALRLRFYWFCIRLCMVAITAIDAHPSHAMVACTYALLVKHRALRDCLRCARIRNPQLCPSSSSGAIVGLNGDVVCKWCVKKVKLFTLLFAGRTTTPTTTTRVNGHIIVIDHRFNGVDTTHMCDRLMACNLLWVARSCICKVNAHCCAHGIMGSVSSNFGKSIWMCIRRRDPIALRTIRTHEDSNFVCAHKYRT